jgi:hypothetical protein
MKIIARQARANMVIKQFGRISAVLLFLFLLSFRPVVIAQDQDQSGQTAEPGQTLTENSEDIESTLEPAEVIVSLPDVHQMAMALATPSLREAALLDLAAAANVLIRSRDEPEVSQTALARGFLNDRAWLQMLVDRHGWVQPHSSVLDPAAWLVLAELQQHDFEDVNLVFPGRTPHSALNIQVFQRTAERLAAANLPILLLEVEADAVSIWEAFLQLAISEELQDAAWKGVEDTWFKDRQWPAPKIPVESDTDEEIDTEGVDVALAMSKLVLSAVYARPPYERDLMQLRYSVLNRRSMSAQVEDWLSHDQARDVLYLSSLVDGLHDGRYFHFVQGLLSTTSRLLEYPYDPEQTFSMVDWLVTELPAISAHYAVGFARVDPRLNMALAASYEVLSNIATAHEKYIAEMTLAGDEVAANAPVDTVAGDNATADTEAAGDGLAGDGDEVNSSVRHHIDVNASRASLADAVAQLAWMIPDMGYYFDTPVRRRIVEEINICLSIAASMDDTGVATMTRRQFDACMEALLQLADRETRLAELSGNMNGPFTIDTLRRELNVTPWQRINFGIGYLHNRYSTSCQPPASPLPNPLEWAVLATTMTWFAEHSPDFVNTPESETRLTRMRDIGEQLILALAGQAACLASAGSEINDPVSRGMTDYELALRELELGIEQAEVDFRENRLNPEADVLLEQDALQNTGYRPENLLIEPCAQQAVCEMSGDLSTTRALIGLFPDEYLIAEQTRMGRIEICYRNMEWVQRRSELVRADDNNVSNYFGRLGFDLVGRYIENDQVSDIFAYRFTSPEEHHYLFAQTSDDVLNDSCPVEWVGSRVVTPLRESRGGIVPDRLTYLAASRSLPSRLLQNNWDRGAEWRDWFVTGIGVTAMEVPLVPDIKTRLNQHLQSLYQAEQAEIYQRVLLPGSRNLQGEDVSLFDEMSRVSIIKALIRMQMMLFYPDSLFNSDKIRTAIAGDSGLLEGRTLRRFREDNVALTTVNTIALERLNELREVWSSQPEAVRREGSVPPSLMNAMTRIDILYRRFFTSRPEPIHEIEVMAEPQEEVESEN